MGGTSGWNGQENMIVFIPKINIGTSWNTVVQGISLTLKYLGMRKY